MQILSYFINMFYWALIIFLSLPPLIYLTMDSVSINKRERKIAAVTLKGSTVNIFLVIIKLIAGLLGHSAAMIADCIHSLSDLATDIVVLVLVRLSSRPRDADHDYGHGKYETLATAIIGVALMVVGLGICYSGVMKIYSAVRGDVLMPPEPVALIAAVVSVVMKEWTYRFTAKAAKNLDSSSLLANAWHHRSDALSSVGTTIGIGGAILLGRSWAVLDPIAAVIVSLLIINAAWKLICHSTGELLEQSLPPEEEAKMIRIAAEDPAVSCIHNLKTRRIGSNIAVDMHVRMPGEMPLYEAHEHATGIERRLKKEFGYGTFVSIHMEPLKSFHSEGKEKGEE